MGLGLPALAPALAPTPVSGALVSPAPSDSGTGPFVDAAVEGELLPTPPPREAGSGMAVTVISVPSGTLREIPVV